MAVVAYSDDVVPTEEFTAFATEVREKARRGWTKEDAARLDAPLGLLLEVVHAKYRDSVAVMVQRAKQAGENVKLSAAISAEFSKRGSLSRATLGKCASLLKRVLAMLDFPAGFLQSLRMLPATKKNARLNPGQIRVATRRAPDACETGELDRDHSERHAQPV